VVVQHVVRFVSVPVTLGGQRRVGRPSTAKPRRGRRPRRGVCHQPHARSQAHWRSAAAADVCGQWRKWRGRRRQRHRRRRTAELSRAAQHGTAVGRRPVPTPGGRHASDACAQPNSQHGTRVAHGRFQRRKQIRARQRLSPDGGSRRTGTTHGVHDL